MRLEPLSNVDNHRSLKERLSALVRAIVDVEVSIEFLGTVATVLVGLGIVGYVAASWLLHLVNAGHYAVSSSLAVALLATVLGAVLRVPMAMLMVFGSAIVCGTAFLLGAGDVLLP